MWRRVAVSVLPDVAKDRSAIVFRREAVQALLKNERIIILRNVGSYLRNNMSPPSRRLEFRKISYRKYLWTLTLSEPIPVAARSTLNWQKQNRNKTETEQKWNRNKSETTVRIPYIRQNADMF
jgi:hypothetical protein